MSWREFISELKRLGVVLVSKTVRGLDGKPVEITYLEHHTDEEVYRCELIADDFEKCVLPSMVRHVCTRLKIHPKVFGLDLG